MSNEGIPNFSSKLPTVFELWPFKVWVPRPFFRLANRVLTFLVFLGTRNFPPNTDTKLKIATQANSGPGFQILYSESAYLQSLKRYRPLKFCFRIGGKWISEM